MIDDSNTPHPNLIHHLENTNAQAAMKMKQTTGTQSQWCQTEI